MMDGTTTLDGSHFTPHTPPLQTVKLTGLSLTEYSSNPSPPSGTTRSRARSLVPEAFLLPNGTPDYLRLILTSKVYEILKETPLTHATNLSNRLECQVLLKREDLQPVFSFKLRGAYNKMAHLDPKIRWKGVVACSAGNHAQGVAYSARHLRIPATIVMPCGTPSIKHLNVSRMGGSVVLHGEDFDAAKGEAHRLELLHGLTNIAPFDDPYVIAGQGTIGMELLRQTNLSELEAIFCCVGGGGLIAGIGVYIKRIAPHVKIIGVETHDANAMVLSLQKGHRVALDNVGLFADGAAVKTVGEETFRLCREVIDDMILVTTDETCAAIKDVFEDTRSIVEPAGALALAGLKKYVASHPSSNTSRQLVALASGANMNFDRLRFVAERAGLGEQKEALLSVTIPERPGAFAELISTVLPYSVTEFSYRYAHSIQASILMGVALPVPTQSFSRTQALDQLLARLASKGMPAEDLSNNELAKSHLRYLGGVLRPPGPPLVARAPSTTGQEPESDSLPEERIYMFSFPERPGALARFLTALKPGANISLFHYRNTGGDVAQVLAGIQIGSGERERGAIEAFLGKLGGWGYGWRDCTRDFGADYGMHVLSECKKKE